MNTEFKCEFCEKILSSVITLKKHQTTTKYCLVLQKKEINEGKFECKGCGKKFLLNDTLKKHYNACKGENSFEKLQKDFEELKKENEILKKENGIIIELKKENEIIKSELEKFRADYKELSLSAVNKPSSTTNTHNNKTIQINNYIKNMPNLTLKDMRQSVPMLSLDHHVQGEEGYAAYALEFPFKDKIVCVDVARNKIKYKNEDGDVVEDIGFKKMMQKLCELIKDRTFVLTGEHYEKLSKKFSKKELEAYDFKETLTAISKYTEGKDSDFMNKMIKLICEKSKLNF